MSGTLFVVQSTVGVTRGDHSIDYVVEEEHDDGSLLIRPQTPLEEMLDRHHTRAMSAEEFEQLIAPHVGPPDGEG